MLALAAVAVWIVTAPLRSSHVEAAQAAEEAERAELEAARDAKYGEIRDAEMDFRTGKLSEADWKAHDRALRREAVEILRKLDRLSNFEP